MILQQCSINGIKYFIKDNGVQEIGKTNTLKMHQYNKELLSFFQALSVCHTVQVAESDKSDESDEIIEENLESTFEIIDSVTAFLNKDEDDTRSAETRSNTLQNEMSAETNLLGDCVPKVTPIQGKNIFYIQFYKY